MTDRLITREAQKAETELRKYNQRMAWAKSAYDARCADITEARVQFVRTLPEDVQRVLAAAGWVLDL